MTIIYKVAILFFSGFMLCNAAITAQKNSKSPIDSALEANSDKWKVKLHKGFGMGKPEFGPYGTLDVEKLDSPVLRQRTKEGSYMGAVITSNSWDWDFSKYKMVEKKKAFRMMVANTTDTTEILFSTYSVTHDKQLTFFGEITSKNDEGKNMTLGYSKHVSGIISISADSLPWRFIIEDSFSRNENQPAYFNDSKRMTSMHMITGDDSLYTEPITQQAGKPGTKYYFEWQKGVYLNSATRSHIAALKFGAAGDLSNPFYVWIRKDIQPEYQKAIASLFALLMMINAS
jgi:hypothetical protein